jgi:hypothetical protein
MRSWAAKSFLVMAVVGLIAVTFTAADDDRDTAFTLGVAPGLAAAEIRPGESACQTPIPVAEPFDGLRMQIGTYKRRGSPLAVAVKRPNTGQVITVGHIPGGFADVSQLKATLGSTVADDQRVAVCIRNLGQRKLALYGGPELARPGSSVEIAGRDQQTDLMLVFTRSSRSLLAQVPEIFERASLFRPVWIGPWAYWLLTGLLVVVVPGLLARSLRDAFAIGGADSARDAGADRQREGSPQP